MRNQDISHGLEVLALIIGNSITGRKRPIPGVPRGIKTAQAALIAAQERTQHEKRETSR
jgi:hypothetical protein